MTEIIKPGCGILFMKVGTHARETLDEIITRKTKEIDDAGYAMWGYGGNTCHPRTMVQPFAEKFQQKGPIFLCMQEMVSKHWAEPLRARDYSANGLQWQTIPNAISVRGSRFALVISELRREKLILPLGQTRVAVGNSFGRIGTRYLMGQVDKACLEVVDGSEKVADTDNKEIQINLVAELRPPYAVFLRDEG